MPIGERIKLVRGALSRPAFGKKIGVSRAAVQNYETLDQIPKGDVLKKIKQEFDVDLNWLVDGEGEPYSRGRQEGLPSADGEGLWGRTRHHELEGKRVDVTLFTPPGSQSEPEDNIDEAFDRAVGGLRRIFNSGDPILISAIRSNITAFEQTVLKDQYSYEQSKRIQKLEGECEALKKQISDLKKLIVKGHSLRGATKSETDTTE